MRFVRVTLVAAAGATILFAGLAGTAAASNPPTVFAAASLTEVFPKLDSKARYSFAGSNTLALQIRQGAPADVFASAAPNFTQELYREGLVEKPVFLAFNRLGVIVPRSNPAGIRTVYDLQRSGVKLVIAGARVPVGAYTRTVFRNLGMSNALRNVVSQENDVKGVVGKVALGEADAGVVYVTDAMGAGDKVAEVDFVESSVAVNTYPIAVLKSAADADAARKFVDLVSGEAGQKILSQAGFAKP